MKEKRRKDEIFGEEKKEGLERMEKDGQTVVDEERKTLEGGKGDRV